MGIYETTYILHPALQEGRLNDIIRTVEKKAESLGAEILFSDNWGRKKLAYLIDKEKYGTYIFFQYKLSDLNNLKELNGEFEHNPNILRYLNIKIEEEDIMQADKKENISTDSIDDKKEDKSNKPENDKENVGEKE
tara:strand:+ start:5096 stop:5503 length:408 start_codon:yes stop_codon:yes gene_type:complete